MSAGADFIMTDEKIPYEDAVSDEVINKGEKVEIAEVVSNMKLKVKKV